MAFSIIANIKSQKQVEITSVTPTPQFLAAIAVNYGGTAADYTFYTLTAEEVIRLESGDEYALIWEGEKLLGVDFSIEDNKGWLRAEVSMVSSKVTFNSVDVQKVQVYQESASFVQNDLVFKDNAVWKCQEAVASKAPEKGVSWSTEAPAVLLTLSILRPDRVTVDDKVEFSTVIPVGMSNDQVANMEAVFSQGICKKVIVLNSIQNCGDWSFPTENQKHLVLNGTSYRIDQVAKFSGLLPY